MSWTTLDASSIKASRTVRINKGIKMSPRPGGGGQVLRNVEEGRSSVRLQKTMFPENTRLSRRTFRNRAKRQRKWDG